MGVSVAAVVFLFECAEEIFGEGEVEFIALAAVTEIDAAVVVWSSLPGFFPEISCCGFFQRSEFEIEFVGGNFTGDSPEDGARIVFHDIAGENS